MKKKVEKWQEPAPAKQHKVLPVPDMEPKKRRGGKRFRKMKERYGLTDMRKAANRCSRDHICSGLTTFICSSMSCQAFVSVEHAVKALSAVIVVELHTYCHQTRGVHSLGCMAQWSYTKHHSSV